MRIDDAFDDLVSRLGSALRELTADDDPQRFFCAVYLRSTEGMRAELARGGFRDPDWVARWTYAFAGLYLEALQARRERRPAPLPWELAFRAGREVPPLVHELVGLNAHLNSDLPQALVSLVSDAEFGDAAVLAVREADFQHVDEVMLRRIPQEYRHLRALGGPVGAEVAARLLYPLNLVASRRWLVSARRAVWHNALELSRARQAGDAQLARRLADLEVLSAAKVADLLRPGQVLLRLAVVGFGVRLPVVPDLPAPSAAVPLPRAGAAPADPRSPS